MYDSDVLIARPAARSLGIGLVLTAVSFVVMAVALPASFGSDGTAGGVMVIIAGLVLIAGFVFLAIGVTRLVAKVDDIHRIYVQVNTDDNPEAE